MPNNTNNTPFTRTDAQWLNTQVTNCMERSADALATAGQALALIKSIKSGAQLLSKTTGVNLNPTILLTYTSLVNTFAAGSTVTDAYGSTAIIVTDNGSNTMTLSTIILATGQNILSGAISATSGGITATAVAGKFSWGDQPIKLNGGKTFIITDIVLTNAGAIPVNASDTEWWGGLARTGINYAVNSNINTTSTTEIESSGSPDDAVLPLANADQYMSISNGQLSLPLQSTGNSPSVCGPLLYFTVGKPEGTALTCDMYMYGYVLN